jgi:hypothetical protein
MQRADYLAFGAAALLVVEFADWFARQQQGQTGALNATGARINPLTSELSEGPADLAAGIADPSMNSGEGAYEPAIGLGR